MLFERHTLTIIILLTSLTEIQAQEPCTIIKNYSIAACRRDTNECVKSLELFRRLHPVDSLIEEVNLALAEIYYGTNKFEESKRISLSIINKKITSQLGGSQECPFVYDSTECRRQIYVVDNFMELQYKACINLYNVYTSEKKFDSALYYLKIADLDFSPSYWCGYTPSSWRRNMLLNYSTVYENMNDIAKAIDVLTPYLMTEQVNDRILYILKKYRNYDQIKDAYRNIEDSITIEYGIVSENPKVKYEQDDLGNILRTTTIEEYGRKAYWHFLGQKFLIAGANDYNSHRINGESRKRKLEIVKSDEQIIKEAKNWIENYTIYKLLFN